MQLKHVLKLSPLCHANFKYSVNYYLSNVPITVISRKNQNFVWKNGSNILNLSNKLVQINVIAFLFVKSRNKAIKLYCTLKKRDKTFNEVPEILVGIYAEWLIIPFLKYFCDRWNAWSSILIQKWSFSQITLT